MLEARIIRESNNQFSSPIVMVKRKDGSWRLCMDYRFPIPLIEELLDELGQTLFFFKLDLSSSYQIRMWKGDIFKTTFKTHGGHYEFMVMPFGLTNAPSMYSSSWTEHLVHLREVLQLLKDNHLFANKASAPLVEGVSSWPIPKTIKELRLSRYYKRFIRHYKYYPFLISNIDACGQGLGVMLHQKGKPMAFFSKGLGIRHQELSIYDKEMLAALLAVKK
ncbi:reverse transcriptase [Gossypium australe]|uniref:Reverse transcriptase n=1 Tax=Gossypium australe TaxID=47621 RepID=A0A5B6X377_9ROSI|nr:reverse transcriptase [Gossypium australe]